MITTDETLKFLSTTLPYEQKLVRVIDAKGRQIEVATFGELLSYRAQGCSIKIEGMERYSNSFFEQCIIQAKNHNHIGPTTCHLFLAFAGSPSFPVHTDPDDVVIHCCEGTKTMVLEDQYIVMKPGDTLYIPADTPHQALNEYDAITLSFGLEKFLKDKCNELDVLS